MYYLFRNGILLEEQNNDTDLKKSLVTLKLHIKGLFTVFKF